MLIIHGWLVTTIKVLLCRVGKLLANRLRRSTELWNTSTGPLLKISELWISMSRHMLHMKRYAFSTRILSFYLFATLSNLQYRILIHIFRSLTRRRSRNKSCLWFAICGITFSSSMKLTKSSCWALVMPILELRFF